MAKVDGIHTALDSCNTDCDHEQIAIDWNSRGIVGGRVVAACKACGNRMWVGQQYVDDDRDIAAWSIVDKDKNADGAYRRVK